MFPQPPPPGYFDRANPALLAAVPPAARVVVDVGCGGGALGAAVKAADPRRAVYGVEREAAAAARAAGRLDRVFALDVGRDELPLADGSVDCVLFGDVLEHLADPEGVLRRCRRLLAPGGCVLACVPNVAHHSVLAGLLRGDFPYAPAGLLDATHLRFFTPASLVKLLLDAGYCPQPVADLRVPPDPALLAAAAPLLAHLRVHPGRAARLLAAYQHVVRGTPLGWADGGPGEPVSVACCVSDEALLEANLLRSPDLAAGGPHEVLLARGSRSAADGLNAALARAKHRWVVCAHQDVYLPRGWFARLAAQLRLAEARWPGVAVAGVYGVAGRGASARRVGRVVDRDRLLDEPVPLPCPADSLDELLLAVRADAGVRFDPACGFHLYGTDACRRAAELGRWAVVLDACCFHNSLTVGLSADFWASARGYAARWRSTLPVATPCVRFASDSDIAEW